MVKIRYYGRIRFYSHSDDADRSRHPDLDEDTERQEVAREPVT